MVVLLRDQDGQEGRHRARPPRRVVKTVTTIPSSIFDKVDTSKMAAGPTENQRIAAHVRRQARDLLLGRRVLPVLRRAALAASSSPCPASAPGRTCSRPPRPARSPPEHPDLQLLRRQLHQSVPRLPVAGDLHQPAVRQLLLHAAKAHGRSRRRWCRSTTARTAASRSSTSATSTRPRAPRTTTRCCRASRGTRSPARFVTRAPTPPRAHWERPTRSPPRVCNMTNGQPGSVCNLPEISKLRTALNK